MPYLFHHIKKGRVHREAVNANSQQHRLHELVEFCAYALVDCAMGAPDFAFGDASNALARILEHYDLFEAKPTDIKSKDGKRLFVYAKNSCILDRITEFINNSELVDCSTSGLQLVPQRNAYAKGSPSFWLCVDGCAPRWKHPEREDWIAIFEDDVMPFLNVMKHEYLAWAKLPEAVRNKRYHDAFVV